MITSRAEIVEYCILNNEYLWQSLRSIALIKNRTDPSKANLEYSLFNRRYSILNVSILYLG
ncbi:hypothetical protein D1BOALGB6SA_9645 [Olavius sp. associated proteobacterium Delta 1]|nr:hypothetical protein D1BOALGB6SA_9645 [Olavius sp. associated proteobacterium Delta 1]